MSKRLVKKTEKKSTVCVCAEGWVGKCMCRRRRDSARARLYGLKTGRQKEKEKERA